MILIADSGSTKTAWILHDRHKTTEYDSIGLNPHHSSDELVMKTLLDLFNTHKEKITEVYFYGAGCSSELNQLYFTKLFSSIFINANVHIMHDMLGAARALCKNEKGVAAILGTGCNSCVYDGNQIIANNFSLGYLLGDEGSGSYMGKKILTLYLNEMLPSDLQILFHQKFNLSNNEIIDTLYKKPQANRFLASFAIFVIENKLDPFISNFINDCFNDFVNFQLKKYTNSKDYPVHFVGSIAFYLQDNLKSVLALNGYKMGIVIQNPIYELVKFHTNKIAL